MGDRAKKERQSGIELLRLLAGFAVMILHLNYTPGGAGLMTTASGVNKAFLLGLEAACLCAVNVFILISGWFSSQAKRIGVRKLALLLAETIACQLLLAVAAGFIDRSWSVRAVLMALLPVNYFVILYLALMLLSPFINRLLEGLDTRAFTCLVCLTAGLFSLAAILVDVLEEVSGMPLVGLNPVGISSMNGYSIVQFVMMYVLGAYMRRVDWPSKCKSPLIAALLVGVVALLMLWDRYLPGTSRSYCNPLVIAEACLVFALFARMKFRSRIVNSLAPASFICFLLQGPILVRVDTPTIGSLPFLQMLGRMLLIMACIYIAAYLLTLAWNLLAGALNRKWPPSLYLSAADGLSRRRDR